MLRKRSVTIELRLRAEAEAMRKARLRLQTVIMKAVTGTLAVAFIFLAVVMDVFVKAEPVIPELHGGGKQLEKLVGTRDFVAVVW